MSIKVEQTRRTIPLRFRGWWYCLRFLCLIWFKLCYRYRCSGRGNIPRDGAVLYVSNHQSFLDPIIVGLATNEPFFALARKTLFKNAFFSWFIRSLSAIPVDQESVGDKGAMRACLEVLQNGQRLLIYPEGARTMDGKTQPFAPGTLLLIRRTKPKVMPVALDGAFEAWPRDGKLRKTGRIRCTLGQPIDAEELLAMENDAALALLRDRVEALRLSMTNDETRMTNQ